MSSWLDRIRGIELPHQKIKRLESENEYLRMENDVYENENESLERERDVYEEEITRYQGKMRENKEIDEGELSYINHVHANAQEMAIDEWGRIDPNALYYRRDVKTIEKRLISNFNVKYRGME